jgi:predicted RNA-binding protein YlqC (UPF0109 family)
MEQDQKFLEYVVQGLVEHPEAVQITRTVDEMGVLLTLTVHKDDMGKVVGRQGATAKAIRTLLRVVGMKNNARVNLKINEPEGGTRAGVPAGSTSAPQREKSVEEALADLEN